MRFASPGFMTRSCERLLRLLRTPSVTTRSLLGVPICWPLAACAGPACIPAIASGIEVSCASGAGSPLPQAASASGKAKIDA